MTVGRELKLPDNSLYIIQPSNTTSNIYLIINEGATSFGH